MKPSVKRLRIAVFNRVFSPTGGGAERYSIALVEQLAAKHEIHIFAQKIEHAWPGVTYHQVSAPLTRPRWLNLFWYATATWWATRIGFDVVHSHESTWHAQVQTVHVLPMKYNLFHGRSGWQFAMRWIKVLTSPRLLAYLFMERMRFTSQPSRCVVVTSPALKDVMAQTYPSASLTVITPGVSLPSTTGNRTSARQQLNLPVQGRLLAFVANDYQKKGLSTLLQALALLPQDVMLAVVGNPIYIKDFRAKAQLLGLGSRVYFLGHLSDVSPLYEAADVLAHPTTEDTFAMVVLEAMAHGLPVVVSAERYCGISGLLTNGVNALILSSPDNVQELADSLSTIIDDAALYQRLANAARQFASGLSWPVLARQQEAVYFQIASAKLNCRTSCPPTL